MLRYVVGVFALFGFVWGLSRVSVALSCRVNCGTDILLGIVGVSVAGLSFAYLAYLFGKLQKSF